MFPEKLNVEHRTSNIECLMGVCFSFEVGRSMFIGFGKLGFRPEQGKGQNDRRGDHPLLVILTAGKDLIT